MPRNRLQRRVLRARKKAKDSLEAKQMDAKHFHAYITALTAYIKGLERLHAKAVSAGRTKTSTALGKKIRQNYEKIRMAQRVAETLERMGKGEIKKAKPHVLGNTIDMEGNK